MSTTQAHDEAGKARELFRSITRDVAWVAEAPKPHKAWLAALAVSTIMVLIGAYSIYVLVTTGIGVWGNSNTVCWAWDITNFVWWIGIGHAGTLISAVLFLTRQHWRVSINRSAEAMTIFAVMCAGLFPLLHTGRPWFAWWMIPHPNDMGMWPRLATPTPYLRRVPRPFAPPPQTAFECLRLDRRAAPTTATGSAERTHASHNSARFPRAAACRAR
jgi:hypothetical protein